MSQKGYKILHQLDLEPEHANSKFIFLKKRKSWLVIIATILIFLLTTQSLVIHHPPQGPIPPGPPKRHGKGPQFPHKNISFDNFDSKISPIEFLNASAIFNEVNNALKQKNAVLSPIGVSFIPAYIPEGTIVYHSTRNGNSIPTEPEWLAFDYEFSYNFAGLNRGNRRHGPPHGGNGTHPPWGLPGGPTGRYPPPSIDSSISIPPSKLRLAKKALDGKNSDGLHEPPRGGRPPPPPPPHDGDDSGPSGKHHVKPGNPPSPHSNSSRPFSGESHMLTFQVERPLDKLIYFPGASAAKTRTGEMDTQFILGGFESYEDFDERKAATKICEWGSSFGLDGYIRLETGFEMVICDFNNKLRLISDVKLSNATNLIGFPGEVYPNEIFQEEEEVEEMEFAQFTDIAEDTEDNIKLNSRGKSDSELDDADAERKLILDKIGSYGGFEHYQAGARVYYDENKVLLDFSNFETPLNRTYVSPDPYLRRIYNVSNDLKEDMLDRIEKSLRHPYNPYDSTNWRVITTNIESKFGPLLLTLNATFNKFGTDNNEKLAKSLSKFTYNYIRRYVDETIGYELTHELKKMAVWDYAHPLQPIRSDSDYLIWSSVAIVQSSLVDIIYDVFKLSTKMLQAYYVDNNSDIEFTDEIIKIQDDLIKLIDDLRWSVSYRCSQACGIDEICFIPTWGPSPIGWGGSLLGYEFDSFGVKRISKDLVCLSPEKLYKAQQEDHH